MESSGTDDLEALTKNPGGRRYWIKPRREIIYKIFKQEILDETLSLPTEKMAEAISQLGEDLTSSMEARIRTFIYRTRKDRSTVLTDDKPCRVTPVSQRSKSYWTPERQKIVRKVFKNEILNTSLIIGKEKLNEAIDKLGGKQDRRMRAKIRKFITKIRNDRRRKQEKDLATSPLPSDSESAEEDTRCDPVTPSSDENQMDVENEDESESKNEVNSYSVVQSLNENNTDLTNNNEVEDSPETRKEDPKSDPVGGSLDGSMDFENNYEVPSSPPKKKENWTPAMVSVMKNHFTQELSASYLPSETDKVDLVRDFLKSKGFDDITRETVFTWADTRSRGELFDDNPEDVLNKVSECLVNGVINGDIDLKFIVDSYMEASDLSEISFDELNHMEEIPLDCSTSKLPDRGDNAEVGGFGLATDVPLMEEKTGCESMPSEDETIPTYQREKIHLT